MKHIEALSLNEQYLLYGSPLTMAYSIEEWDISEKRILTDSQLSKVQSYYEKTGLVRITRQPDPIPILVVLTSDRDIWEWDRSDKVQVVFKPGPVVIYSDTMASNPEAKPWVNTMASEKNMVKTKNSSQFFYKKPKRLQAYQEINPNYTSSYLPSLYSPPIVAPLMTIQIIVILRLIYIFFLKNLIWACQNLWPFNIIFTVQVQRAVDSSENEFAAIKPQWDNFLCVLIAKWLTQQIHELNRSMSSTGP